MEENGKRRDRLIWQVKEKLSVQYAPPHKRPIRYTVMMKIHKWIKWIEKVCIEAESKVGNQRWGGEWTCSTSNCYADDLNPCPVNLFVCYIKKNHDHNLSPTLSQRCTCLKGNFRISWTLFSHCFVSKWRAGTRVFEICPVLSETAAAGSTLRAIHSVKVGPLKVLVDRLRCYFKCYIMKRIPTAIDFSVKE